MVSVKGLEIILFKLSLFQYADRIAKSFYLKMIWDYPTQKREAGELQKGCQFHDFRALEVIQRSRVPKETNPGEPGKGPQKRMPHPEGHPKENQARCKKIHWAINILENGTYSRYTQG